MTEQKQIQKAATARELLRITQEIKQRKMAKKEMVRKEMEVYTAKKTM